MKLNKFFLVVFLLTVAICELHFGYWFSTNPFHFIKTTYKDNKYIFYNKFHQGEKKIDFVLNKYGMRYNSNEIDNLFMIAFGSGIVLQSTITEGKTFLDYIKKINNKIANFGSDGFSTSGILNTLKLLDEKTNLHSQYYIFIIGANEGDLNNNYIDRKFKAWNIENKLFLYLNKNSFLFKKLIEAVRSLKLILTNYDYVKNLFKNYPSIKHPILNKKNYVNISYDQKDYNFVLSILEKQQNLTKNNLLEIYKIVNKKFESKIIFMTLPHAYGYKKDDKIFVFKDLIDYDNEIKRLDTNVLTNKVFVQYNYLRNKVISDQIINFCKNLSKSLCINGFDDLNLDPEEDFHDGFHLNEIGSMKVGEYLFSKLKNDIF